MKHLHDLARSPHAAADFDKIHIAAITRYIKEKGEYPVKFTRVSTGKTDDYYFSSITVMMGWQKLNCTVEEWYKRNRPKGDYDANQETVDRQGDQQK